jgi:endonuclease/exonuclease/phosphatase family metal-dependent hydrolase
MMKKQLFLLIAVFIFLVSACSNTRDKDAIHVMTFNVRYDNPDDSINAWPNRISLINNLLKKEKPDIIGMQEVLYHQYEFLDSVLADYSSVGVGRDDGAKEGEMNPIFFKKDKFEEVRTITFWLSKTPEEAGSKSWGSSLPRIVTWIELVDVDDHQHFFLFNTHFAHDSDSARIMSSKALLRAVEKISSGYPLIITGDFNMNQSSTGYKILIGPDESVPLLKDSYTISEKKPTGSKSTFNGFSNKNSTERLDFIFVRNGMKVTDIKTIIKKTNGVYVSDHWPVEATVLLK